MNRLALALTGAILGANPSAAIGSSSDHVYTLYRMSTVGSARIHVGTFDAAGQPDGYNRHNCYFGRPISYAAARRAWRLLLVRAGTVSPVSAVFGRIAMAARLGLVIYWAGCILAGLLVLFGMYAASVEPHGAVGIMVGAGGAAAVAWLLGRAVRFVLAGN